MGKVINLRQTRKQKARADKHKISAAATAVTGVKKPERSRVTRLNEMADRSHEGHKRDDDT